MTVINSSSLDMMTRQSVSTDKKADSTVDDLLGFKNILKNKNQKKDNDNTKNQNDENSMTSDLALLAVAANNLEVQGQEGNVQSQEQKTLLSLSESNNTETGDIKAVTGMDASAQKILQYQQIGKLQLQNITGKYQNVQQGDDESKVEGEKLPNLEYASDLKAQTAESSVSDLTAGGSEKKSISFLSQLGANSVQKQGDIKTTEPTVEAQDEKSSLVEKSFVITQSGSENKLQDNTEEDQEEGSASEQDNKKGLSDTISLFQEKPLEQKQTVEVHTDGDVTVYSTVKADDVNQLEANLSEAIIKEIDSGSKELEVQLEPENLGKIHIKISYDEEQISVSVLCSESKTLKLISQSAGELGSIMESNLERPIQVLVDNHETDYLNNQENREGKQGQGHQQQQQNTEQEDDKVDFIQKLRLGILEADSID